jgi:hypothetical protein
MSTMASNETVSHSSINWINLTRGTHTTTLTLTLTLTSLVPNQQIQPCQ